MKQVKLTNEEIAVVCSSLAYLIHAGSGAGDALALMAEDAGATPVGTALEAMARQADGGAGLAECFRSAACFPQYVCTLLDVGERTGRTEAALRALGDYYDGLARLENRLRTALLYPSVLLMVMLAVIVALLVWVLPVFNDVYARLGSSLTGLAGGLLSLGTLLRKIMPLLVAVMLVLVLLLIFFAVSGAVRGKLLALWRRKRSDRGLSRAIQTARFAQALAMAMHSGFTPEDALALAMTLAEDSGAFRARCAQCLALAERGSSLSEALSKSEMFPRSDCRLLEAGIRGGNGESAMDQIAARLMEQSAQGVEERIGRIEPTLVVITSVMVGVILLSVMLPLIHIMNAIG